MKTRWPNAFAVLLKLEQAGYQAYVVGGAVRDHLLGLPSKDIDIATDAPPEEVMVLFTKTFATGIEHGTVTVVENGEAIEVTTFRVESHYVNHRRPEGVTFVRNLEDDLARRDYTINAMALSYRDELIDCFGGREDLLNQTIRAVGLAKERFEEDALRILRGIRLAAQLRFQIDGTTWEAMLATSHLLKHIAKERIKQEVGRVWTFSNPEYALTSLRNPCFHNVLPGNYQVLPVKVQPSLTEQHGWAWFHYFQTAHYEFPYSNVEKRLQAEVKKAMVKFQEVGWTYETILDTSDAALEVCFELLGSTTNFQSLDAMKQWVTKSPLRYSSDLEISGKQLMQLVKRPPGPWIKEVNRELSKRILYGELQNDYSELEKWVKKHVQ